MAINEWKIWQTLGLAKKPAPEKIDIDSDLKQIENFLESACSAVSSIKSLIKQFRQLRKERDKLILGKASKSSLKKNLESQIKTYDRLMASYEFFDLDEDISAERVKKIARALKQSAEKLKISEKLLNKIKTEERWTYNW